MRARSRRAGGGRICRPRSSRRRGVRVSGRGRRRKRNAKLCPQVTVYRMMFGQIVDDTSFNLEALAQALQRRGRSRIVLEFHSMFDEANTVDQRRVRLCGPQMAGLAGSGCGGLDSCLRVYGTWGRRRCQSTSRLSLIPKGIMRRSVAKLRPCGHAPSLQKVAAKTILEEALEHLVPQHMNSYAFRLRPEIILMVMPLGLLVERRRETGQSLSLLQVEIEDAFGAVRFDIARASIAWARGARFLFTGFLLASKPRSVGAERLTPTGYTFASVAVRGRPRCPCCGSAS